MESYLLKSNICLACFYACYWLFIRYQNRFDLNRFTILFSIVMSAILPLITIDLFTYERSSIAQNLEPIIFTSGAASSIVENTQYSYSIYSIVYIVGLLIGSIRSITGMATLVKLHRSSPRSSYHGFKAVIVKGNFAPFTIFNLLFINETDFRKEKVNELMTHEHIHKNQYHSLDLILIELCTIVFWFNPFMWLFRRDLKAEHEFYVDEQVLRNGFESLTYQKLLIQSNDGLASYLANNFNNSLLKKRVKMMNKTKSIHPSKFRYLLGIAVLIISASTLFLNFQVKTANDSTPDVMPEYKGGIEAFYKKIQTTIRYPEEARKSNTHGKVLVSFTVSEKGKATEIKVENKSYNLLEEIVVVGYLRSAFGTGNDPDMKILENECHRAIAYVGKFNPGTKDGKPVAVRLTLPITFKLSQ